MSLNATNDSDICATSLRLAQDPAIYVVHGVNVCLSVLGIFCNAPFVFALWRHKALHRNLRILLANHSVCVSLLCVCVLFQTSYYLNYRRAQAVANSCAIMLQMRACVAIGAPRVAFIQMTIFSMAATAAERAFATWKYKTYEAYTSLKVPVVLILMQFGLTLILQTGRFLAPQLDGSTAYCATYLYGITSVFPSLAASLSMEVFAITLYGVTMLINKRKQETSLINQSMHTLALRYQLSENIRSTLMLIPTVAVNPFCFLPSTVTVIILNLLGTVKNVSSPSYDISIAVYEWMCLLMPLYSILYPSICFRSNKGLRAELVRSLPVFAQKWIASVGPQKDNVQSLKTQQAVDSNEYFNLLTKMWQKERARAS